MADASVGQLRYRTAGRRAAAALLRLVANLIGLGAGSRARRPSAPARPRSADFVSTCSAAGSPTARTSWPRAPRSSAATSSAGAQRARRAGAPAAAEEGDWRARVLTVAERGARAVERTALGARPASWSTRRAASTATAAQRRGDRELVIVAPGPDAAAGAARPTRCTRELEAGLHGLRAHGRASAATPPTRPTCTAPAPRRCWPPTWPRRAGSSSSRSRRPAPTGCCCRR